MVVDCVVSTSWMSVFVICLILKVTPVLNPLHWWTFLLTWVPVSHCLFDIDSWHNVSVCNTSVGSLVSELVVLFGSLVLELVVLLVVLFQTINTCFTNTFIVSALNKQCDTMTTQIYKYEFPVEFGISWNNSVEYNSLVTFMTCCFTYLFQSMSMSN